MGTRTIQEQPNDAGRQTEQDRPLEERESPEEKAWLLSRLYFLWTRPLFERAAALSKRSEEDNQSRALEHDDLLPLANMDQGSTVSKQFQAAWDAWQGPPSDSGDASSTDRLSFAIKTMLGRSFWVAGIIKLCNTLFQFSFPLLLNQILLYIEDIQKDPDEHGAITDDDPWEVRYRGYWLSALLLFVMAMKAVMENAYFHRVYRGGYQARVAVSIAVYNKSLRLANAERQSTTLGELVNLMQVDAAKIEMFVPQVHVLWDGILQVVGYMAILYSLISWPCLIGLAVMIFTAPVQVIVMGKLFGLNRSLSKFTDVRVKSINEVLQGIQSVKMYTWEQPVQDDIATSRGAELGFLGRVAYLRGFSRAYMSALPGLVAVCTFVCLALAVDEPIKASTLFAALAAFDQLRFPLMFYPMSLAMLAQAKVSGGRLQSYLSLKEIQNTETVSRSPSDAVAKPASGDPNTKEGSHADDDERTAHTRPAVLVSGTHKRERSDTTAEIRIDHASIYWNDPNTPLVDQSGKGEQETKDDSSNNGDTNSVASSQDLESLGASSNPPARYPKAILSDISVHVAQGRLCAVVGRVASGKSTLVSAILNETILQSGSISLTGTVAYAAQSPWILNATLRDNILFGQPYEEEKYQQVLKVAQLTHDLELLDGGDMVEIGEKGINLSGGQKQRVSIARAAYSNAQVVILDDPLSALDPEVGRKVFEDCIVGMMEGKTRLFVTNQLQFLPKCDHIIALKHGRIVEQGTYDAMEASDGGEVRRLLQDISNKQHKQQEESEKAQAAKHVKAKSTPSKASHSTFKTKEFVVKNVQSSGPAPKATSASNDPVSEKMATTTPAAAAAANPNKDDAAPKTTTGSLLTTEERSMGAVSLSVYLKYIAAGGGFAKFMIVIIGYIIGSANALATGVWVSLWTSDSDYEDRSQAFYLTGYALLAVMLGVTTFIRSVVLVRFGVSASTSLHKGLIQSILRAPQSFFDTTPVGRILSRFSKDMYSIDIELADFMDFVLFCWLQVIVSLGTILFVTPFFGIFVLPLGYMYIRFMNYFRNVSRETKRLESIARSPVYAQFSETLGGLTTIRAYDQLERFVHEFEQKVNSNTRATYCNRTADRWLGVRLESIGAVIAGSAAFLASDVALRTDDSNFASLAGLSLTFAISITALLNFGVRSFASLEAAMNSCERVLYYSEHIPQEAAFTSQELLLKSSMDNAGPGASSASGGGRDADAAIPPSVFAVAAKGGQCSPVDASWPQHGQIQLSNLKMRYRSDTPLVIKGLNLTIHGGERVGVVGRTGSGKSSLLLCLLRLVEPDMAGETKESYVSPISIDGVDTLRIGLQELRSRIGIIPQNPVLFSGTIRSNIDPFHQHTDDDIWTALDQCGMKDAVEAMPGLLHAVVAEYGENLSAGMRQLLVLGRALLKQCKILLLDEATSSVDYETDKEIQRTIRQAFKGCTVLTIAHRINTIMDSDKILVMKDGLVEEFASPEDLLADETTTFSEIVRQTQTNNDEDGDGETGGAMGAIGEDNESSVEPVEERT